MDIKTQTGNGANFSVSVPDTTNRPNGSPGSAPSGASLPVPPSFGGNTGVPTQQQDAANVPNRVTKQGGNHGGTISPSPIPTGKGVPGVPQNTTIPNR